MPKIETSVDAEGIITTVEYTTDENGKKIKVLSPDVNCSVRDFSIEDGNSIRFGLLAIKGVGAGIVEGIIKDRAENGHYRHLYEFCERTKPSGSLITTAPPLRVQRTAWVKPLDSERMPANVPALFTARSCSSSRSLLSPDQRSSPHRPNLHSL